MGRGSKMLKDTALTYCLFYLMTLSAEIIRRWQMKCEKGTGVRTTREIISTRGKKNSSQIQERGLRFLRRTTGKGIQHLAFFFTQ
jgi:4-hydroxyphenylpyruvate dioxygenase-like putative hemolysin